ncbi:MAG: enolase C-terminal domain-like protein [Caldilineaceae bacterium]
MTGKDAPTALRVPCYDTSLYFDDLHLADNAEAAALLAEETRQGYARGHRNFKIKVGRGARHLPVDKGTERDIAVIRAVREAAGPAAVLMIDANNGYTLNLTKRVLSETADCRLYWLEEAFHEDAVLYRDLKEWLAAQGLPVLIADGEGEASPSLLKWAQDGLIDVVQYDIFGYGFTSWLALGQKLDSSSVRSAPHHYGRGIGNYAAGHLAAAIGGFTFVEWDEATVAEIDASGYVIDEGFVRVPDAPGFGLNLDEEMFGRSVSDNGYSVTRDDGMMR